MKPSPLINREIAAARGNEARAALLCAASSHPWNIRQDGEHRLLSTIADTALSIWHMEDEYADEPEYVITAEGIAIIPITGTLLDSEPNWWMNYLGYASTPHIGRMVQDAAGDMRVSYIALYCDSPGGQASGIATVADIIFAVREAGEKPIVALVKDACSAAYHLASQCERVVVTQDGVTGCIGTVIISADWSKFYEDLGISIERITNTGGETYKGAGARGTAITPKQKEDLARICDEYQSLFTANVARGRSLSLESAAALADGRYYIGANGVSLSLADNVIPIEDAMLLLASGEQWPSPPPSATPQPDATPDDDTEQASTRLRYDASRIGGMTQNHKEQKQMPLPKIFQRGADKPKPETEPEASVTPLSPTAEAILAQLDAEGITSTDQLTAALRDARNGRSAMEARRTEATATAVKAFGQNSDRLERAKKAIASATDFDDLQNLQAVYEEQIPEALKGKGQQTVSEPVADKESAASDTEFFNSIREQAKNQAGKVG